MSEVRTLEPPPPPPYSPRSLLALLERQHAVTNELAALAEAQSALIAAGQTDALLDLLAKRQVLIDQFSTAQDELGQVAAQAELKSPQRPGIAAERERIAALVGQISERLSYIMRCDESAAGEIMASRDQVRRELSSVSAAAQARHAYSGSTSRQEPPASANRFADQRG